MNDGIISGTGNSRKIYGSLPSTYAAFKTAVENGSQTLDILFNSAGWSQQPTFLTKATLLADATSTQYALTSADPTVNEALAKARTLITTAQTTAEGRARISYGSYSGTGEYGASNANSLTFAFAPKFLFITDNVTGNTHAMFAIPGYNAYVIYTTATGSYTSGSVYRMSTSLSGNTVSWSNTTSARFQLNSSGTTYRYIGIG